MNAAKTHIDLPTDTRLGSQAPSSQDATLEGFDPASGLSALVDGELTDAELDGLLAGMAHGSTTLAAWHNYQVIGDVLRASAPAAAAKPSQDFLVGIHARLQAEAPLAQPPQPQRPAQPAPVAVLGHVRAPAANDAVFRWKMVAGLASLAAVMAVSWTVLGTAPSGAGGSNAAGPQLALMGTNPGISSGTGAPLVQEAAVVVDTPQGMVIRDAQLEALMAEHRQNGGMSALQMPAGFLRNATYDATGR